MLAPLPCAALVLLSAALCGAQAHYPRPRRPELAENSQASNFLKELQDYYSVHGRGRYGKRQMHIADASVIFRETPFFDQTSNDDSLFKNFIHNLNKK